MKLFLSVVGLATLIFAQVDLHIQDLFQILKGGITIITFDDKQAGGGSGVKYHKKVYT